MWTILVILTVASLSRAQVAPDQQNADGQVLSSNNFAEVPGYELVPEKPLEELSALDRCGEGATKGISICVPYYQCDAKTNTIVQTGKTDGFGIIDIRFGANSCEHPLDVCCKLGQGGPPTSTERPPIVTPPVTPPVIKPLQCGIRHPNGIDFKITGNVAGESEYGEFPWMVAILKNNYNSSIDKTLAICGGSLIAPNVVLTGAHCVYKYKPEEIKIRAGEWDTQTEKERLPYQERTIKTIIIHEHFNSQSLFNDFALLVLNRAVDRADNIGTICLPSQGEIINSANCIGTGWGKNKFGREGEFQVILKKIELPTVASDRCQDLLRKTRLGTHFILDKSFMCAGAEAEKDTCTGDGGSPLICPDPKNPTRYIQVGIVAWGIGCGESNIPGVYADVTKFRNWIDENMGRLNLDTSAYNN